MKIKFAFWALSLGLISGLFLVSCSNNTKEEVVKSGIKPLLDSLFNKNADIRRFNFGMAREEFDLGDDSSVLENERDLVVESINLKAADSVFAECSYHFENDLLQSGEINIFSPSDSINAIVMDSVKRSLTRLYGSNTDAKGFYRWHTKGKKGYEMDIFVGDMSMELGSPTTQIQMHATIVEKAMLAQTWVVQRIFLKS